MAKARESKKKKPKKIYFNAETDSRISGLALVLTFLACGVVLQFSPDYFGNGIVTGIIKWVVFIIGILGFCTEAGKAKTGIIGLDNLFLGIFCIASWFALFWFGRHWLTNSIGFILLIFGAFAFFQGIQQVIYSAVLTKTTKKEKTIEEKQEQKADILLFLTKLFGVVLVVVQIIKVVIDMNLTSQP